MLNSMDRIQNFINGELQIIADDLRQEVVDAQYEDMIDELAELAELASQYTFADDGANDCDGPWYWELN